MEFRLFNSIEMLKIEGKRKSKHYFLQAKKPWIVNNCSAINNLIVELISIAMSLYA